MRIIFLTQDDPIYVLPLFDEFFRTYYDRFEISGVFCSRTMGKRNRVQLLKEMLSLYGPFGFVRLLGRVALAKLLGKLPASKQARSFRSLGQLCKAFNVYYSRVTNPNDAGILSELRRRAPDVIVSVACPHILKESILDLPPKGCVNIHHAPLPHYRGMMPTFWQMFHGEPRVGLTVHYMVQEVDAGAALLIESLEIEANETLDHLIRRSKKYGAHCVARVLAEIEVGAAKPTSFDNLRGSYFTVPTIAEIREFHRRGFKAI
jgi:methionyl-tRNA formyltransferase